MTTITVQKQDARRTIGGLMTQYLDTRPDRARAIALGACSDLAGGMTLTELKAWQEKLEKAVAEECNDPHTPQP